MRNRAIILSKYVCLLAMLMAVLSCTKKSQKDCGFVQNVYGQRISWKDNLPVSLTIDPSVPENLRPAIYRAAQSWNKALATEAFKLTVGHKNNTLPLKDRKNGIYFLSQWDSNIKAEQGRTSVYWSGDEIVEADIRINASQFVFYEKPIQDKMAQRDFFFGTKEFVLQILRLNNKEYETSLSSHSVMIEPEQRVTYNFEALVLHEMGHVLGLKHKEGSESVMSAYLAAQSDRVQLANSDLKNVNCEYNK